MNINYKNDLELRKKFIPIIKDGKSFHLNSYSGFYSEEEKIGICSYGFLTPGKTLAVIYRNGQSRPDKGITCFCSYKPFKSPSPIFYPKDKQIGHLWPAHYCMYDKTKAALSDSNYTVNTIPETRTLNCGPILKIEDACFDKAKAGTTLLIYTGRITTGTAGTWINGVRVPEYVYKVIAEPAIQRVCCYIMPNEEFLVNNISGYYRPLCEVERSSGVKFPTLKNYTDTPDLLDITREITAFESEEIQAELIAKNQWVMTANLIIWRIDKNGVKHKQVVPRGFVHDFASSPWLVQWLVPRRDDHTDKSAVGHDWDYATEYFSWKGIAYKYLPDLTENRAACDEDFRDALKAEGCSILKRNIMYAAVRMGGGFVWDKHTIISIEQNRQLLNIGK